MYIYTNSLKFILLLLSIGCVVASTFGFSFVYSENPTGSLFDSIKFSQLFQNSEGEKIPTLVEELKLFCLISLGGFCVAFISYLLKMFGKSFTGMTLIFILSVLVGVGTFLLMRLGLAQMISDGAAFGISWYFAYTAFALLVIGYWYGKKAPSNITDELVD